MSVAGHVLKQFGVDWPHFTAQVVLFLTAYFVLRRLAFKPVLGMLAERQRLIEESKLNAERAKSLLAEAELRRQVILRKANEEAQILFREARAASKAQTQRELQQTKQRAELMIVRAEESIANERAKMISEVQGQIAALVVKTTAKVIGRVLTEKDRKRLSAEVLRAVTS
ncbi:MAG: F0F1 ATP synthase subunit B [Candidatus Xiphinematobacter sp.]|nr:MAG: F0F1 ATP synthase subunit B [Candidatus Xiphinematobacter sp.]